MTKARDQKYFAVSEVSAHRHELLIPQHTMRPSIARTSEQLDPHSLQPADIPLPQSATLGLIISRSVSDQLHMFGQIGSDIDM